DAGCRWRPEIRLWAPPRKLWNSPSWGKLFRRFGRRHAMPAERDDKRGGLGVGHVEAANKAGQRRAAPVELEPIGLERIHRTDGQLEKDFVGLGRRDQRHPGDPFETRRDAGGGAVRLGGET